MTDYEWMVVTRVGSPTDFPSTDRATDALPHRDEPIGVLHPPHEPEVLERRHQRCCRNEGGRGAAIYDENNVRKL